LTYICSTEAIPNRKGVVVVAAKACHKLQWGVWGVHASKPLGSFSKQNAGRTGLVADHKDKTSSAPFKLNLRNMALTLPLDSRNRYG
jgi:hypothetical protein